MPREMFPVASVMVSAYHTIPSLIILFVACIMNGWSPDGAGILAGLLGFSIMLVLGTGLALLFSAANVFFRDFQNIVGTVTNFVHFSVPMIYPSPWCTRALVMAWSESGWRTRSPSRCCCSSAASGFRPSRTPRTPPIKMPDDLFARGFVMLGIAILFLGFSQLVFSRLESKFPERLSS